MTESRQSGGNCLRKWPWTVIWRMGRLNQEKRKEPLSRREQAVQSTRSVRECDEVVRWSQHGWSPGRKVRGKTCPGDPAQELGSCSSCSGRLFRGEAIWRRIRLLQVGPACSLEDIYPPWRDLCHQELALSFSWLTTLGYTWVVCVLISTHPVSLREGWPVPSPPPWTSTAGLVPERAEGQ